METRYRADYSRLNRNVSAVQAQSTHVNTLTTGLSTTVSELQQRSKQYEVLNKSVADIIEDLNRRKQISDLASRAIAEGDRSAFQEISSNAEKENNNIIKQIAISEIVRINAFWVGMSRTVGMTLNLNGKTIKAADLNTCQLIQSVRNSPDWSVRDVLVTELGHRKQAGVPETLLNSIKSDPSLEVVRDATSA